MALLLKIVIGCLIAIALVVCFAVVAFILTIRKHLKDCLRDDGVPLSIHLHEDLAPEWTESKEASELIQSFNALGFTAGRAYLIEEMDNIRLVSLFNQQYTAVIYDVEDSGLFFDIAQLSVDGTSLTVSNSPFGGALEQAPEKEKLLLEDVTVSEAFQIISDKRGAFESVVATNENFREIFEKFYKQDIEYKNRNGGVSREEFNKLVNLGKERYSEEQLRVAFLDFKATELENWSDAGLEEYFETNEISDDERYDGGCFLLVPQKSDPEAFLHYLSHYDLVQEEHIDKIVNVVGNESNTHTLFERINNARSPDLRAVEKGSVAFPVEAKIYQLAA